MAEVNRSINIYLNEADVAASLDKMRNKAEKLENQLKQTSDPETWKKLRTDLDATTANMGKLEGQLSGKLNPSLKQMAAAISQAKNEMNRFVGSQNELEKKAASIGKMEAEYNKLRERLQGVSKAAGESAGVFAGFKDKMADFARSLPGVGQAFSAMLGPVGLVVGAITALVGILMQNAEVADEFNFAMAGLKNTIRTLADILVGLIKNGFEKLREAINNPKQALKDFGDALQQNVINRFKAFGVFVDAISLAMQGKWSEAAKKATDAVIQLGTGVQEGTNKMAAFGSAMADAYNRGSDSERMLDAMGKKQAELRQQIERTNIAIAEQSTIMKDNTKTDRDRLAAAEAIIRMETLNADRRIKSIALELEALKKKQDYLQLSGEEESRLIDLQTEKLQAQTAKIDAIRKATIERNQLQAALAAQSLSNLTSETIKNVNEIATTVTDTMQRSVVPALKGILVGIHKDFKEFSDWLGSEWGQAVQAGVQAVVNIMGSAMQISDNVLDRKLQQIDKQFSKENQKLEEQRKQNLISEEAYALKHEALKKDQARKEAALKRDAFIKDKAMKITMAVINTALAVVNSLASAPWPVNIVMAALAAATGAVQIGVIASQPVPQFAKGGKLAGPRHSDGGVPIAVSGRVVAEAEGDEWIINRRSSNDFHHALDAINKNDSSIQWLKGFPRVNMPFAISGGQLVAGENGPVSAVAPAQDGIKKHIAHGNRLQVESAKYIVNGIVNGLAATERAKARKL
jgi:hypothetical protein